jgi:hypothetical protein
MTQRKRYRAFAGAKKLRLVLLAMASLELVIQPSLSAQEESGQPAGSRWQARSMVETRFGILATSQTLASAAGARILEMGGNAIDAAIAANAVLGVVEPMMNGIGGDLFAIVYEAKTGKLYGLNASGWAPTGLTIEALERQKITKMPRAGIYSVTVPGAVAGWDLLRTKFGTMPWGRILTPAIYYAENGFPVTEIIGAHWQNFAKALATNGSKGAKDTYLPDGEAPKIGQMFRNRDLAASLRLIAAHGRDGFYKGANAQALIREANAGGVEWTAADLAGRTDLDHLSRLDCNGVASQRTGDGGTCHAQYDGTLPAFRIRPQQRQGPSCDDRSQEARLRGSVAVRGRSPLHQRTRRCASVKGHHGGASQADRYPACDLRRNTD